MEALKTESAAGFNQIEHADQSEIISIQEKLGSTFEANFEGSLLVSIMVSSVDYGPF